MWLGVCGNAAISIHAPREGGDGAHLEKGVNRFISIHAPREGGDFPSCGS